MKIAFVIMALLAPITTLAQPEAQKAFDAGVNSLKHEDFEKAISEFSTAISKGEGGSNEGMKMAYVYRAFAKNGLQRYAEAVEDLSKAIELDSNDLATFIDRAKSFLYLKDMKSAKIDYLHVLAIDSSGKQAEAAYYYLGLIAFNEADFEGSVLYYTKLLKLAPRDYQVYFNRGAAKDRLMDMEGAIEDYDKAIEINPNYKEAYANRGFTKINLLTARGNVNPDKTETADACRDLKKARELGDTTVEDMLYIYCR